MKSTSTRESFTTIPESATSPIRLRIVAGLPVMGAFPLNDTDQALRLIAAALPVRLEWMTPWWGSLEPA